MAFTRAQATALLNKTEMRLYDDSRANALRGQDRAALAARVERTRAARDRARDLLKRQRLAARKRGEGKGDDIAARTARKEALLVEILERFVEARRAAPVAATKKTVAKKAVKNAAVKTPAAGRAAAARKPAAKKPTAKKSAAATKATAAPVSKAAAVRKAAKKGGTKATTKAASPRASAARVPVKKSARKAAARTAPAKRSASRRGLSPEKALENTRRLLEAKQERDGSAQPWQALDPTVDHAPQPGYQSPQAASKAHELHAGEARMASIHGSMSTRDRHNQGKRDHRNGDGD